MQIVNPLKLQIAAEQRMVLNSVSWQGFLNILESLGEQRAVRLAYAQNVLELIMPLEIHELIKELLGDLVKAWADSYDLDYTPLGSWTMRRGDLMQGIEPDACFYIQSVEAVRGKRTLNLIELPPPDLVIEVDITNSSKLRQPIYQALGVPELWRWTEDGLTILHLAEGKYQAQPTSRLYPLTAQKLTELVNYGLDTTPAQAKRLFRTWLLSIKEGN